MAVQALLLAKSGGEYIGWLGKTNVSELGLSSLQKTGGTGGTWDAGAYSSQQAASSQKIRIETTVTSISSICMIGINTLADAPADAYYINLKFAIFQFHKGFYSSESGTVTGIGTFEMGDILFVEFNPAASEVIYGRIYNGAETVFRTVSSVSFISYPLVADCSHESANSILYNCRILIG